MRGRPAEHSDEGFAKGFSRHTIAEIVEKSNTPEEFAVKLKVFEEEKYTAFLFNEQRFLNIVFLIQWVIPEIIGNAYELGHLNNEPALYRMVVRRTKENWKLRDCTEAESLLEDETKGNRSRIYTPHAMLYLGGLGLGDFVHIFRQHFNDPSLDKLQVIPLLEKINTVRNYFVHIPFSSRIDLEGEVKNIIPTTISAHEMLTVTYGTQWRILHPNEAGNLEM